MSKDKLTENYLLRIFQDFMTTWYIYVGIDLGIFDFIHKKKIYSINEMAKMLNFREEILENWCECMVVEGILELEDNKYKLSKWAQKYLCKDSNSYIGYILSAVEYFTEAFTKFEQAFNINRKFPKKSSAEMLKIAKNIAPIANIVGPLIMENIEKNKKLNVLDIGCGMGYYLIYIATHVNDMKGLGIDIEKKIIKEAKKNIIKLNLNNKIKFLVKDALNIKLNEKFDIVILSNIVQAFSYEQNLKLFNKIRDLLNDDGKVFVIDCLLQENKYESKFNVFFNLYLKFESLNARLYTLNEIKNIASETSLKFDKHQNIFYGIDMIIFRK